MFWGPLTSYNTLRYFLSISLSETPHEQKTLDRKRKLSTIFLIDVFERNQKTLCKCKKLYTKKVRRYCIKFLNYPVADNFRMIDKVFNCWRPEGWVWLLFWIDYWRSQTERLPDHNFLHYCYWLPKPGRLWRTWTLLSNYWLYTAHNLTIWVPWLTVHCFRTPRLFSFNSPDQFSFMIGQYG